MLLGNRASQSLLTHTRLWYLIDAKDQINGRLAAYIAQILQGKTKPIYHPSQDVGDFVVVVNTKDIVFTGRKWDRKVYRYHTGYPGGFKEISASSLHSRDQTRVLWRSVNGMLPKNQLRKIRMARLFLFEGPKHPYAENIYAHLKGPASMPKRLDEYSLEEFAKYPKLF